MNINENTDLIGFIVWLICSCNLGILFDKMSSAGVDEDEVPELQKLQEIVKERDIKHLK